MDLEEIIFLLLDVTYDNRRKGLDWEEEYELLLELDEEYKDYLKNNNNIDESDTISEIPEGLLQKISSGT